MDKECQYCHNKYVIKDDYYKAKQGDFCSSKCRSLSNGSSIEKDCEQCGKKFIFKLSANRRVDGNRGRFCCKNCYDDWQRRNQRVEKCKLCGKEIIVSTKNRHIYNNTFCGKSCYASYRNRDLSGKYIDGDINANRSYRLIARENNENCCSLCGYDKIQEILHVHHKDGNRLDHDPNNLEILCPNCHCEKHLEMKHLKESIFYN